MWPAWEPVIDVPGVHSRRANLHINEYFDVEIRCAGSASNSGTNRLKEKGSRTDTSENGPATRGAVSVLGDVFWNVTVSVA